VLCCEVIWAHRVAADAPGRARRRLALRAQQKRNLTSDQGDDVCVCDVDAVVVKSEEKMVCVGEDVCACGGGGSQCD
jgi:hypothetical protein